MENEAVKAIIEYKRKLEESFKTAILDFEEQTNVFVGNVTLFRTTISEFEEEDKILLDKVVFDCVVDPFVQKKGGSQ